MRTVLMVFAWGGLIVGILSAVFMLALNELRGALVVPALGYVLGALFWFALCSVLAETHRNVEDLADRLGDVRRDLYEVRKRLRDAP